ncbi:MAG: Rrf2 family transcriptional regulator [Patescibacteria group bacterium]
MFQGKAKIEYGLMIMTELAAQPGEYVSVSNLAKKSQISSIYLIQIAKSLRRAGLLNSKEGAHGGYMLTRPADQISLLSIIEALDNSLGQAGGDGQKFSCHHHGAWNLIAATVKQKLAEENLASLIRLNR